MGVERKSQLEGDYVVEGLSAIMEYAKFTPEKIKKIYVIPKMYDKVLRSLAPHLSKDRLKEIREKEVDKNKQDVVPVHAIIAHKISEWEEFSHKLKKKNLNRLMILDQVTDTRNLGAIIRSAAFFGCQAVLVMKRRQTLLTQAAVSTAQGGFAHVDFVAVTNLSRLIRDLKEHEFWIIGADVNGEDIASIRRDFEKIVLVLGAEDTGISENVRKHCDLLAKIPSKSGLDSLNVSVAAGIFLFEF